MGEQKLMKLTIEYEYDRATKGTHRYVPGDPTGPIAGTLYIKKAALSGKEAPAAFTVTIEDGDNEVEDV